MAKGCGKDRLEDRSDSESPGLHRMQDARKQHQPCFHLALSFVQCALETEH